MSKENKDKSGEEADREEYIAEGKLRGERTPNRELSRKLSVRGRRGFLSLLASFGISAASIRGLSRDVLATEDYKSSVPFTAKYRVKDVNKLRDRDPGERLEIKAEKERVSRGFWARNKAVRKAANRVRSNLNKEGKSPRVGIGTNPAGKQIVEVHKSPTVDTTSEGIEKFLPESVPAKVERGKGKSPEEFNIPVNTKSVGYKRQSCDFPSSIDDPNYTSTYSELPGGALATFKKKGPLATDGAFGTTGTPVYSNDRGQFEMLTAGHNFEDPESTDMYKQVYQPCENDSDIVGFHEVNGNTPDSKTWEDFDGNGVEGWTKYSADTLDAGVFHMKNGHSTDYALASNGGGTNEILGGYQSWEKIQLGVGKIDMNKQGFRTGRNSGIVEFADDSAKWFATDAYSQTGDSGGPHFVYNNSNDLDDVLVSGIHSVAVYYDNDSSDEGSGAYALDRILSEYNLSFI